MATRYCHLQRNNVLKFLTCLLPLHASFRFRLRDKLMRYQSQFRQKGLASTPPCNCLCICYCPLSPPRFCPQDN
ncbi:hypothetical protein CICLE_v10029740mg [Citrus x clementina]|uniref:Uncharacterized protein n=1 Tax=Citrus clementina TaxID=85681 RepID=V4U9D0_CITCL|nr:hypothetical protein CICLE_v10029740mg [Citrus x clementina]